MFNPSFRPCTYSSSDNKDEEYRSPLSLYCRLLRLHPWVIVPNGSYQGYFDWVPIHYRIGTWSIQAPTVLVGMFIYLIYMKPNQDDGWEPYQNVSNENDQNHHHSGSAASFLPTTSFGGWECYNLGAAAWMTLVLVKNIQQEGIFVPYCTFTTWSWTLLWLRHVLSVTIAIFLSFSYYASSEPLLLVQWKEALRCPALLNACIVFFVWNLILAPGIYVTQMKTKKEKSQFRKWLVTFNLLNQHGLNLPLAMLSCIVSEPTRKFTIRQDLWYGQVVLYLYMLFYVLVLDRMGVHLYPIFSPRSSTCGIIWMALVLLHYGLFKGIQTWVEQKLETSC